MLKPLLITLAVVVLVSMHYTAKNIEAEKAATCAANPGLEFYCGAPTTTKAI